MFVGVFSLLCIIELQNVLDFRTYTRPSFKDDTSFWSSVPPEILDQWDVNSIPHEERLECIYSRGLALEFVNWILSHFELIDITPAVPVSERPKRHCKQLQPQPQPQPPPSDNDLIHNVYYPFLAHIAAAVQQYKTDRPKSVSYECTLTLLENQIKFCIDGRGMLQSDFDSKAGEFAKGTKSIVPPFGFTIKRRVIPLPFSRECFLFQSCNITIIHPTSSNPSPAYGIRFASWGSTLS